MLSKSATSIQATVSKPRTSIRARIIMLSLLLIVPLIADRVRILISTRGTLIASAVEEVADLAQRGTEAQSEILNATRALLQVVARAYVALEPSGENCAAFLTGFATDVSWIRSLSVVGPDDRIWCSTRASVAGIDVSDRKYIRQARGTGQFVLSEYLVERTGEPSIMAAYPVLGKDGSASAVILAPVELRWVERFAQLIHARKGASAFLMDREGRVLSTLPGRGELADLGAPDQPLIRAATAKSAGTLRATGGDGVPRIYAFSELPGTDTRIVVEFDEREVLRRINRNISIAYLQLGVFGALALMLAWIGGERFIIAPIHALTRTAADIGRGELEQRHSPERWTVEFAPLAAAVNDMARKLAAREGELRAANRHLEEQALIDALSGLPNRRAFDMRLAAAWHNAEPGAPISLLMIDADQFKLFNDTYGHLEGDNCLRLIAKALEFAVRGGDLAARYGGEEFVVLLPGVDPAAALEVAERCRQGVEKARIPHRASPSGFVTISIGIATQTPGGAGDEQALLEAADMALYDAKRRGRNTAAVWSPLVLAKAG
jgi:diguanylate cyclase (GGDEF)-like protein